MQLRKILDKKWMKRTMGLIVFTCITIVFFNMVWLADEIRLNNGDSLEAFSKQTVLRLQDNIDLNRRLLTQLRLEVLRKKEATPSEIYALLTEYKIVWSLRPYRFFDE